MLLKGKSDVAERPPSHCYFAYHKFHMEWLAIEFGFPQAGNQLPDQLHGYFLFMNTNIVKYMELSFFL